MPRRPKPTALRALDGNAGHRPANGREPSPDLAFPDAPTYLDARGREEWVNLGRELFRCKMLTRLDRANLASYCAAVSRLEKSEVALRKWERVAEGDKLTAKEMGRAVFMMNATSGKRRLAAQEVHRLGAEFGMTPSARSKIRIDDSQLQLGIIEGVVDPLAAARATLLGLNQSQDRSAG